MAQAATQDFLEIDKIREGIVILKNKGLRAILMVSSLNFALKSDEEQNAIIYQFQNFLNSLDFPCQIVIQSRRRNMTGYLEGLSIAEQKEKNELLKIQIYEYRKFIESILQRGTIMQKGFYVIVPFALPEIKTMGSAEIKKFMKTSSLKEEEFQRCKIQLLQRAEFVALGLRGCGLDAVLLNSLEIVELFWSLHHPVEAEKGYYPDFPPELVT